MATETCPNCDGTGMTMAASRYTEPATACLLCGGTGEIQVQKSEKTPPSEEKAKS